MLRDTRISATVDIGAKIDQFESAIHKIQGELGKLSLDNMTKGDFESIFKNIETRIKNIQNTTKEGQLKLIDEKKTTEEFNKLASGYKELIAKLKSSNVNTSFLEKDAKVIEALKAQIGVYTRQVEKSNQAWRDQEKDLKASLAQARALKTEAKNEYDAAKDSAKAKIDAERDINKAKKENLTTAKHELAELEKQKNAQEKFASAWKKQHDNMRGMNTAYASKTGNTWDLNIVTKYNEAVNKVTQAQNEANAAQERFNQVSKENNTSSYADLKVKLDQANQAVRDAEANLKTFQATNAQIDTTTFDKIREALLNIPGINWAEYNVDPSTVKSIEDLQIVYNAVSSVAAPKAEEAVRIINEQLNIAKSSGEAARQGYEEAAKGVKKLGGTASDIERLTGRLVRFFSIDNAVRLFRRAIRSAAETVKELDKAMTETAVVTNFTVSDMWKTLPEYTKRANELGLAVKDVYEASTLYYQQGLSTQEVVSLTNATLRMARIASLDAADATDRMTNALRGFNMELTQANADNVADVYSKLAAISASNVDEISTAMTKVASLAHSANMEFENTAAFLAQIIETTRESAETAGTALKTVVARFSEVKNLYTKGDLLGTDENGEEIDVNKVSKALRTAGINLNEFLTGQKGLDEIFMELAEKWDSLDIVQQRYIATMAAGSRQQSRFIALMSDYRRTQELTMAANNASGASLEQYNKTLESVETKVARLKNAWNEFLMGIANDEAIKGILDFANEFLTAINKITDSISGGNGLIKAIANIGIAVGGLKLGGTFVRKMLGDPTTGAQGWVGKFILGFKGQTSAITAAGARVGNKFWAGFQQFKAADGIKGWITKQFGKYSDLTAKELFGTDTISLETLSLSVPKKTMIQGGSDLAKSLGQQIKIAEQQALATGDGTAYAAFKKLNQQLGQNKLSIQQLQAANEQYNLNLEATTEDIDKSSIALKNQQQAANIGGTSLLALGGIFLIISSAIEKMTGKANIVSQLFRNIGIAFMALGAVIITVSRTSSAAIMSIPIIGWITAIITLITAAITVLVHFANKAKEEAKEAAEAVQSATEELNKAKDAVENLQTSIDELGEKEKKIEELRRGTKEWTQAVKEHNDQVLQLVGTYKNLRLINRNGLLTIENLDEVQSNMAQEVTMKNVALAGARIRANNANNNLARENFATSATGVELTVTLQQQDDGGAVIKDVLQEIIGKEGFYDSIIDSDYVINALKELGYETTAQILGNAPEGTSSYKALNEIVNELRREQKVKVENEPDLVAFGYLISSLTDASTAASTFADSFMNDTDRINKKLDEELKDNPAKHHHDLSDEDKKLYEEFVRDTYHTTVGSNGSFLNNGATVYYETVAKDFQTWKTADKLAGQMEKYTRELERMAKDGTEQQKAIAQALSATEGNNVTTETIKQLFPEQNINWEELLKKDEKEIKEDAQFGEYFKKQWEDAADGTELKILYESAEDYVDAMYDTIIPAVDTFYQKLGNDQTGLGEQIRNLKFDAGTSKALFDKFSSVFEAGGWEGLLDFNEIVKDPDKVEEFADALSKLNFRNQHDLDEFSKTLEELGIAVDNDKLEKYLTQLSEAAHSLQQIDISKFVENSKDLAKVISDIRSGKQTRSFSEDIYNKLIEIGVDASNFTYAEDGSYLYIGEKLDDVIDAINEQTDELTGTGRRQIEAKEAAYEIAQEIDTGIIKAGNATGIGEGYYQFTQEDEDKEYLRQVMQAYAAQGKNINDLGINNFYNGTDLNALSADTLASIRKQFTETIVANYHTWSEQLTKLQDSDVLTEQMKHTASEIAANYGTGNEKQTEAQRAALLSKAYSAGTPEEVLNAFVENKNWTQQTATQISEVAEAYAEAIELGFDTTKLQEWANELEKTRDLSVGTATKIALANTKINTGIEKIISSYEDWENLVGKNGPLGKGTSFTFNSNEENEAYKALKKNLELTLNLNSALSDQFFESERATSAILSLANGTEEEKKKAYEDLQKLAAIDFIEPFNEQKKNLENLILNMDLPDIQVGATIENGPFLQQLKAMIAMAGDAADEMCKALGIKQEITQWKETPKFTWVMDPDTLEYKKVPVMEPVYEYKWIRTGSPSGISNKNLTTTGSKDSGSGSSSKAKNWKNPYDELYNLQEHINAALREREKLEANYQRMLENHRTTGEELQKQSMKEIASLQKQLYYQKQMMAGRKRQMANVLNETYEDSEGNRKTYGSMGLQKYAWYEEDTQTVHIEWDKINQVTDEDQGKAIEAYVSRLEELRDQMQDVEDAIDEANDQIREIQMRNTEEYIDFEQRVYDALVNQYQREIDMLGEINQSVTDATNKTLDAISEEIEKERQARENEKAREELSDKEARLAYLQRDTSGMNALEIQKLQQELENERQSYQDSIVDQTLQEMRDEAARAEAQRQAQIDMMQGQLDWWQEVGYPLWEQVETLMSTGVDNTGKIISDSALDKLLTANDNVAAMSKIAAFKWTQDLAKEVAAQFEGKANWMMEMARDAGEATDAKGKRYKYNASENKWYDENGNEVNVYYRNGQYVAEKVQKPKEVSVGSGAQQPGGTQTSPSTQPKTPPSGPPQTPPIETTLSDNDKKAFAALYLAGYYNQESLANEIGKNNAGQSISYGHGNNYLYDLFTQAVGGNTKWQSNSSWKKYIKGNTTWKKYAQGGLADFTGPAWLDGTKSHPEMVLNATDTQNLITLKNILGAILQNANSASKTSTGDNYFDINIDAQISSDYDVDQLSERIKKQIYDDASYRNVNTLHYIR